MSTTTSPSLAALTETAEQFLDAWNTQEVDQVLACYTPDVVFSDPSTGGAIRGAEALSRYLTRLFDRWQMHWELRELHPYAEGGVNLLWRASLRRSGGSGSVNVDGMDLVLLRDGLIARNEVQFDRSVLLPLLAK